eukprot:CAMPEP_0114631008 /NCGR_PEP_ID=MMETSP0168-20121206/14186_1 /TAXON_ID=95228 ORGANISM="Vannella sp., Strain DIVA3 517/6/12" /NCGR_SAMPLE_ID=MMETSP0168 /ASSEMBLY_ACC=CAM_ASM_000044 /LENGTH=158 /DNA_ID=CAMNT_0001842551 /DNA_START=44 /DNA_END=520 /DNA_ORIENTATION=+
MPAWWQAKPASRSSLSSLLRERCSWVWNCCSLSVHDGLAGLDGVLPAVDEDHHLVAVADGFDCLRVSDLVHALLLLQNLAPACGAVDADVLLRERDRAVAVVEIEEALTRVHPEEEGDVNEVRKRRRETHDADHCLRPLHLALRTRNDRLDHRAAVLV